MKRVVFVVLLLLSASASYAGFAPTRPQNITYTARSPQELRAQLGAWIDSTQARGPSAQEALDIGEAWSLIGQSQRRAGHADSALAAYARAYNARGMRDDAIPLADLLLARAQRGDADSAKHVLEPLRSEAEDSRVPSARALMVRYAWATAQTGHTREALAMATSQRDYLASHADWALRFSTLAMEAGQDSTALVWLWPGIVRSRGADLNAMALARRAANRRLRPGELERRVERSRVVADSLDEMALDRVPTSFKMSDGALLRAWLLPARTSGAPLAVIAPGPEEPAVALYDSLASQLRRAGYAVAIVDMRGVRGSVSAEHSGPEAWSDETNAQAMLTQAAADMGAAITSAVVATRADPRRVVLFTEGPLAVAGALAVRAKAANALVLLTPAPAACERGWLIDALTVSGARTFVQTAPEDIYTNDALDRVMTLLPPARVRSAEARANGRGGAIFRQDASLAPRIVQWLRDAWPAKAASVTPKVAAPKKRR
jgi:hypothetical protein